VYSEKNISVSKSKTLINNDKDKKTAQNAADIDIDIHHKDVINNKDHAKENDSKTLIDDKNEISLNDNENNE